ncbi:MAG: cytochrome ubiquinol oxidase subunit I [Cyanobacteria bacterium SZAS LIN-3]|nr:cytochrome ubiquinol oxidase subunit I [Cyanobacteria bacterium SZAS LIN-3]
MHLDVVMLSRIQFALTLMFHYIFPPLTIGMGVLMVIIEAIWIKTGDASYKAMSLFWTKLFAINFALGVATGIVMEFQFGTNWATYSRYVGDIFGSALAAEAIFAFFLESGFLAVLVFGWDRVQPKTHFFATCMVALGAIFSSIWITVANSWQQTPSGYRIIKTVAGFYRAEVTNFWQMVFNPSMVHRVLHVWLGAFILGALFALSIGSYYLLKNKHIIFAQRTVKISLIYAAVCSFLMLVSGHFQADGVAKNQPVKLAALEGHYITGSGGTPMYGFGWPSDRDKDVKFGLAVPGMLSFLVHQNFDKPVAGLDKVPEEDRPPVWLTFQSYHLMVALGLGFIGMTALGLVFLKLGTLYQQKWLLWIYVFSVLGGYAANESGWIAAEVGRQPWVVYGLLRTKDAVSKAIGTEHVIGSMIMFGLVYTFLFFVWVWVMNHRIQLGPPETAKVAADHEKEAAVAKAKDPFAAIAGLLKRGPSSLSDSWRTQDPPVVESIKDEAEKKPEGLN